VSGIENKRCPKKIWQKDNTEEVRKDSDKCEYSEPGGRKFKSKVKIQIGKRS
jgi:hypothetical protein